MNFRDLRKHLCSTDKLCFLKGCKNSRSKLFVASKYQKEFGTAFLSSVFQQPLPLNRESLTFCLRYFQSPWHLKKSQPWINFCSVQEEILLFHYTRMRQPKCKREINGKRYMAESRINLHSCSRYIKSYRCISESLEEMQCAVLWKKF